MVSFLHELIEMIAKMRPKPKQQDSSLKNATNLADLLHAYCKEIETWPESWEIAEEDVIIGQAITDQFKFFLINRLEKGLAKKTIRNYAHFLWALGGELIRSINEDDNERRLSARELILKYTDDSGGPYWRHASDESEHSRYDSVCKQLFKFITMNPN